MVSSISAKELQGYLDEKLSPTIIDVRAPEAYERGHLPGAINIPRDQLASSLSQIPHDRPIVSYCNMHNPGFSSSEQAVHMLRDAGLHARVLEGGYPAWKEGGYPIDTVQHALPEKLHAANLQAFAIGKSQ